MSLSDKDHVPVASKLLGDLLSSHWKELGIKIEKIDTVFRYLVSKFVFSDEPLSEREKVALFTAYEGMVNKSAVDKHYAKKHSWWLFITRNLAQSLNGEISENSRNEFAKMIQTFTSKGRGYFSGAIYFGIKIKGEKLYQIWIKTRFPKTTKAKSRIAVGYRDKGHLKKSHDGTPHWSEVSMALYEHESESTSEKQDDYWRNLMIHPLQRLSS